MPNGTGTATSEQAILAAARAEFERYGVRRTAMDDIARRAGISRSTLYRRSPAKEALFERLVFEVAGSLRRSGVTMFDEDVRAVAEILIRLTMSILLNPEGSSTIFNAVCTIRSRTAGIDNSRNSADPGLVPRPTRHRASFVTTRQASLHVTDRSVAHPATRGARAGLRHRPFPDDTTNLLPGLLTATRTGLPPASDDELTNQPSTVYTINHQPFLDAQESHQ
jgi:AcrR family transcriptional regulator